MTQIIVLVIIALYVASCIAIGISSAKAASSTEGFLLGGRAIGPWLSAFAYGTSYFSAVIFVGYAGMFGYLIGMGSMWIGVGNALFGTLLAWLLLAKRARSLTHELGARTMPEFFAARFGSRNMKIYAALIIFVFLVPYAAGVYKGLGTLFSLVFNGANPIICMAIVAVLTGVYLVLGGYIASSKTDFFQGIIMLIGIAFMVAIVLSRPEVGGVSGLVEKLGRLGDQFVSPTGGSFFKMLCVNILLTSFGVYGLPQMVHKYYAIKDEGSIKIATVVSTVFALAIGVGAYLVGSTGRLFVPALADGTPDIAGSYDGVVPKILLTALSGNIFSIIVLGIIVVLLLSASMSTLSAIVLSSSSAITIDLIAETKKDLSEKSEVRIMRLFCVLFVALSFIFASLNITFIVNLMSFSWGVVAGSFIGPFIWGLYKDNISRLGAWAGLLSGPVVVFGLLIYNCIVLPGGFAEAKAMAPEFGVIAMGVSVILTPVLGCIGKKK